VVREVVAVLEVLAVQGVLEVPVLEVLEVLEDVPVLEVPVLEVLDVLEAAVLAARGDRHFHNI
jgi:hypothetical protein